MVVTVFLLGRPGSGKSTAARRIEELAQWQGCPTIHIYDYEILHSWFMLEMESRGNEHKYFRPREHDGFDVSDFLVLRKALEEIERRVQEHVPSKKKLILVEFARNDYSEVLKVFRANLLQSAYFLFFDADLKTCIQRLHERSLHPTTEHDHFVSEEIIRSYYSKDNRSYMLFQFAQDYDLDNERVTVVDNAGSWDDFLQQIKAFITTLFDREPDLSLDIPAQAATPL